MSGKLGIGNGTNYDFLTLVDGMTIGELVDTLNQLPREGKISLQPAELISEKNLRLPVEVAGGQLAGKEL